jgi:predicted N-acetyltransferase YhbS
MAKRDTEDPERYGPWHPGIQSQVPKELWPLSTIFRPDNVFTSIASACELQGLTGFPPSELVAFRPQRLALHELLIRVTADFAVPDGSRIGDLGINFREIASRLFERHLAPEMDAITAAFDRTRRELRDAVDAALAEVVPIQAPLGGVSKSSPMARLVAIMAGRRGAMAMTGAKPAATPTVPSGAEDRGWGPRHIAACERLAGSAVDSRQRIVYRTLARVMSALFATQGHAWGTRELIASMATDMACNDLGSDAVGRAIEPLLLRAAVCEGYSLLPRQERPVVINTKGPSASGKSTLRPLQKTLASDIGVRWSDFALISPDIWRKQLLDYAALGAAYKYAGAFTAEELQIVDQKLDRYMARKHRRGEMTHLLIDRFRFDSFAPDSDEEGSNLLTRFGQTVFLFFMITPPESLVERAWNRGLEFGRYKAVDDTLAHAVEAYTGIPDVFFTWVRRSDKRIHFEFLDNTVHLGERPRTVAFGDNETFNVLNVKAILDIERYGRVNVDAAGADLLYPEPALLDPEHNTGFLRRCVEGFREVNFAHQSSGRIYLRIESGTPDSVDKAALQSASSDPDTLAGLRAVAPGALRGDVADLGAPRYLRGAGGAQSATLGQWGAKRPVAANIKIRTETPLDVPAIDAVTISAFLSAPHTSHTEQFIVGALRKAGLLTISLVADAEGIVIGHVAVSPVSISDGAPGWFGLGPISVAPEHQCRGVGSRLMHEALRILRERGAAGCVLLGEPEYYGRFGFQADPNLILPGVPPEYFQAISLDSSRPHGTVSYHAAFDARESESC